MDTPLQQNENAHDLELEKKAKLYDLLNDPLLIAVPVLNHVVQDIFGFKFFMGDCTLDDVINEIDEMLQNERNQRGAT